MDFSKGFKMLQDLIDIVEKEINERADDERIKWFGTGENRLVFRGSDSITALAETVDYFWTSDKDIFNTISRQTIQEKLLNFIRDNINGEGGNQDTLKGLIRDLKSIPIQKFEILYYLLGVTFLSDYPLEIGPYTIYNKKIHRNFLLKKYPHSLGILTGEFDDKNIKSDIVIGVYTNARENLRANENARLMLQQFEDTIRFMVCDINKSSDVGIFNFNLKRWTTGIILSEKTVQVRGHMSGTIGDIPLHQFPINKSENGHNKIWKILNNTNQTDLEKRIINAIGWVGKGLRDEEPARAFIQYIFGIESLLQFQQKGVLVSPSITYQISEYAAFIISKELDTRLEIEKMVKNLYSKRSSIAHGGSSNVSETDLYNAMYLIKRIITILVKDEEFKDIKTIQQLSDWVNTKKYA